MAFLLTRSRVRSPAALSRACARCFSAGRSSEAATAILDILKHGSAPPRERAATQHLASRVGAQTLPDARARLRELQEVDQRTSFQKQIYRKWQPGDVYAPHDLSGPEQKKWKTARRTPQSDAFDTLGINPVTEYKNFTIMSEYMTETGRIKHSRDTGLRPKNQRKIAKAIRRAIGLGLMPSVHRHPLVLKKSPPSRFL